MIDEAYLLKGENKNDPGRVVIQLLMNVLADENNRDMIQTADKTLCLKTFCEEIKKRDMILSV